MSDARRLIPAPEWRLFYVACFTLLWIGSALAQSPADWLERMVSANGKYNYRGTLVHMCGGEMDIVSIVHRVDDGQVTERITARSVNGRQIIRNADEVMCILPDQKKVTVERRDVASSPISEQISNFPSFSNINGSLYKVALLGSDRVAEHDAVMLAVRPVDQYRYGYRLWLHTETAVPIRFELVDGSGQGLEQGMYTEIEFSESIPARAVEPTIATDDFEWQLSAAVRDPSPGAEASEKPASSPVLSRWRAAKLPAGFELVIAESKIADGDEVSMEQLVYSDGLATISVFIEASDEDAAAVEGMSNIGATHAFTTMRDGFMITAMGGVPLETVRMVALSVGPR